MTTPPEGTSSLPLLYARWIEEFLESPPPVESRSTCHDCPMISSDPAKNTSQHFFHPETKCCTYWPEIPNFLAGLILSDDDPSIAKARAQMEKFLTTEMMITPLGASPPSSFFAQYQNQKSFGTERSLLCPFYQQGKTGNCGIWKYRNGRCATWFCHFERGSISVVFWKYMDQMLNTIEKILSRWCILQSDFSSEALQQIFPPPRSQMWVTPMMWGEWKGKQREFFIECARLVDLLSWKEVSEIGGVELEVPSRLVRDAYANLVKRDIPARLRLNQWKHSLAVDAETIRIWTYSRYDPVEVPRRIVDVLGYFQHSPTDETIHRIEKEKGVRLDPDYVRWLVDFGVLADA